MRYYYEEYCFDQDTFTLYYNDQPQALKANEAKLLALFIANQQSILTKDQILAEIWGQQCVSEQVVFQNISQLRSLFGRTAIKTFPKKGYQWQLPFEVQPTAQTEQNTSSVITVKSSPHHLHLAASLILISVVVVIFWLSLRASSTQSLNNSELYFIPFSSTDDAIKPQLSSFNRIIEQYSSFNNASENLLSTTTASLFTFPESTKHALKLGKGAIIVSGYLSSYHEQLLLEYKLLGDKRSWSGYLIDQDEESLASSLRTTIEDLQRTDYLNEPNTALLSSKLRLLLDQKPNNPSVIYHLLQRQLNEQNYDVAKALTEKLIRLTKNTPNSPYLALGLFIKGVIYHQQHQFSQALQYYNQSLAQLADNTFLEIRYKVEISLAWLAYAQQAPDKMQQHIHNAATYALHKKEVLSQVSAYTTGSILSHKLDDIINRYKYLNTAKSLLLTHQVPAAHFAIIHYHLALFASDNKEAESYYLKVLSLPKSTQYQWLYESATEDLLSWYIAQENWQEASSLFDSQPENSFNLSQKARLLHAMHDKTTAIDSAKRAFDQARLNYQHNNALHAALLLYQLQEPLSEHYTPDYQDYITQNASQFWLKKHNDELTKLGYFDGLTN